MKASELIARIQELIAGQGDVNVYQGDMQKLTKGDLLLVDTVPEPGSEKYGQKYLHIGAY